MRYIQDRETFKLLPADEWFQKYGSEKVQTHIVIPDVPEYQSPVDGKLVSGRVQRKQDLLRTKSREWEGMEQEKKEAARIRKYNEEKHDREVHKMVEQSFMRLNEKTRRYLGA
jgi:hypothetical protein